MPESLTIALLQYPGACRSFTRSGSSYPPLGLCQIAATVEPDKALVLDADGEGWGEEKTIREIQILSPKYVGMTATSYTLKEVEFWAKKLKDLRIQSIVGGPHASLDPVDLLIQCPSVEAIVRGEAELVFPSIVQRISEDKSLLGLPGVVVREKDGWVGTVRNESSSIQRVHDFSRLPFPRWDNLPIPNYQCPDARRHPMLTFMTTRGCPHRCGFCSSPQLLGQKVRGWNVEQILDELERLVFVYGVKEISFVDDVFTIDKKRTYSLCEGMIRRELELSWFCNARADQIQPQLAEMMAQAGCHQVYLGFESGSQQILDRIQKGTTITKLEEGAEYLKKVGIQRSVGFVIGLPGETNETVRMSIDMAWRVQPERLQFTRWTPLPGSPLAQEYHTHSFGFHHSQSDDQVSRWVQEAYEACAGQSWGARSW